MTPDQVVEAAKLVNKRARLVKELAEVNGRLVKIGVDVNAPPAAEKPKGK